jgi:hypothetical protein
VLSLINFPAIPVALDADHVTRAPKHVIRFRQSLLSVSQMAEWSHAGQLVVAFSVTMDARSSNPRTRKTDRVSRIYPVDAPDGRSVDSVLLSHGK